MWRPGPRLAAMHNSRAKNEVLVVLVVMLGQVSGTRNGLPWPPRGHTIELTDAEAAQLIETQMAVPAVDPESGVEIAVRDQTAVEKREALVKQPRKGAV